MFFPGAMAGLAVVCREGGACVTRLTMGFLDDLLVLGRMAGLTHLYPHISATGLNQLLQTVGVLLLVGSCHRDVQQQAQKWDQIDIGTK